MSTPLSKQERGFQLRSFSRNYSALYLAVSRRVWTAAARPAPVALSRDGRPLICYNTGGAGVRPRVWDASLPFPRVCSGSCPPTQPLGGILIPQRAAHGIALLRRWSNSAPHDPLPPLLFYAALRDEMTRRREGRLHASCDPEAIRFSRRTNLSKRYNFDVGAFIRCRRFLLGRYLFHILLLCSACAFACVRVCLLCCRSMQTTSSSPPIRTSAVQSNNSAIWTWTLCSPCK